LRSEEWGCARICRFAAWRRRELHRQPKVAGSIPASGENRCSSVVRALVNLGPRVPAARDSGVVKVCVTSVERCSESCRGCEFDALLRWECQAKAWAHGNSSKQTREPMVPTGRVTGMVKSRVTSIDTEAGPSAPHCAQWFLPVSFVCGDGLPHQRGWTWWRAGLLRLVIER
jgi:hypothetical protein